MRRLLTGYAIHFNRRHKRHGQLFQNRYKSIICQEDIYFKELGYDLKKISQMVSTIYDIEIEEIYSKGRRKVQVEARDLLCYWAVRELDML